VPSLIRAAKERAKHSLNTLFVAGQRFGVDILPRHFYSGIPDIRELRKNESWRVPHSMFGIEGANIDPQLDFVRDCVSDSIARVLRNENVYEQACRKNGAVGYGPIEAQFLFCFAAHHRPRRIIQIGAGASTALMLHAFETVGHTAEIVCIDPYPTAFLKSAAGQQHITLIEKPCQAVELSLYEGLGDGDFLFIDSTHTVKPGSEVNLLILEVLQRLHRGCHVHFHDIYFPYDYSPSTLNSIFFWNETALLLAFLTGNSRYAISASMSMLHHARPDELKKIFPDYSPMPMDRGLEANGDSGHFPSATYLRVVG
jgi:predicted O-methyltransferase YrrM